MATVEFWRTKRVLEVTGLSRSELYRLMDRQEFPRFRKYPTGKNFWISNEVQQWQRKLLGEDEFTELLG